MFKLGDLVYPGPPVFKKMKSYWNKMGKNSRNYLFIIGEGAVIHIGWIETPQGPRVYSLDKYQGAPSLLQEKGYLPLELEKVEEILRGLVRDIIGSIPKEKNYGLNKGFY